MQRLDIETWVYLFREMREYRETIVVMRLDEADVWCLSLDECEVLEKGFKTEAEARERLAYLEKTVLQIENNLLERMESKYPDYVYKDVGEKLKMSKKEINNLPREEVFTNLIAWKLGYPQWAEDIRGWIEDIYNIKLDDSKIGKLDLLALSIEGLIMNINQIKELEKTKVTPEQWEQIRHSSHVKRVKLLGKERGKSDYEIIFNDCTSVIVYV
ncbi:hypothetical protein [Brevibacillus laterosporus]|uniref:hypothetical protein n=1 Tax=Brevibacillus laterosporus TaxID=1465 RepID=UPI003D24B90E